MSSHRTVAHVLFAVVAGAVLLSGCATRTSDKDLVFLDATNAAKAVQGERRGLTGRTQGVWVDPRSPQEFQTEHIPGAINLPLERAREDHMMLNKYDVLIVYGDDHNSPRALALSKTLIELGYSDVRTLRGGLRAWKEAGYEVRDSSSE